MDLLLSFGDSLYWGRKKKANYEGLGWDPNFWIYLMTYVLVGSLLAGLFHVYNAEKHEPKPANEEGWPQTLPPAARRNELRKITV